MATNKKALLLESRQNNNTLIIPQNPTAENVLNNMPDVLKDILVLFQEKHINTSFNCISNVLLAKTAQMLTAKRITLKEVDNELIPNWYSIIFMPSGAGKDRLSNDFDKLIFNDFRLWFKNRADNYRREKEQEISKIAQEKFQDSKSENQKQAFINSEKEKIRNIIIEMQDGTQEGFYADAKSFSSATFGSLFLKISEFGLYLKTTNTDKEMFLNCLYNAYDGKVVSKCIKGSNREPDIENLPVNILLYSDYTLFKTDVKELFNSLMLTGLNRRACVSFMGTTSRQAPIFSHEQKKNFTQKVEELQKRLFGVFNSVQMNSCYCLSAEANNDILNCYVQYLTDCYNNTEELILKSEILSRELKALKLACLYACLNHPQELFIKKNDLIQAITTVQGLSGDLNIFNNYKPQKTDEYDNFYNFFKENVETKYKKCELIKEFMTLGISRRKAVDEFERIISTIKEFASTDGYLLLDEKINNNSGTVYFLHDPNEKLNENIKPLLKIL